MPQKRHPTTSTRFLFRRDYESSKCFGSSHRVWGVDAMYDWVCLHSRSIYLIDTEREEVSLDRRVEREKHTMKMKMICQVTIIIMRTWLESQQKMKNLLDVNSRRNRRDDEEKLRNNFTLNVIAVVFVAPVPGYDSIWIRQRRGNVETSADTRAKFNKQKRFWLLRGEKKTSLDCAVHKNFDDFCARRWRFRFFFGDRILIYF